MNLMSIIIVEANKNKYRTQHLSSKNQIKLSSNFKNITPNFYFEFTETDYLVFWKYLESSM